MRCHSVRHFTSLFSALAMLLAASASHADWPWWRGPGRDGKALDANLPATLPAKLPAPRWKIVVGDGYASPVVAGGRVFIHALEKPGTEVCLCLDASSGKELWRRAYAASFVPPDAKAGRGPNSTPAVDGDRVYMLGLGGMFHCLDIKDGRILWQHDFAKEYWGVQKDKDGDDAWFPCCGASASPLVFGANVVVPVGGAKGGSLTAFDRVTGKLAWKALAERSSYGSPVVAKLPGGAQFVGFTGLRMVGLRVADRKLLWDHPFPANYEQTVLTPVVWKHLVIFGGEKKPTLAVRLTATGDQVTKDIAWQNKDLRAYLTTPVVMGDRLIGHDARLNQLVGLDLATGTTAWQYDGVASFVSLVAAGSRLLVLGDDCNLHVLKITAAGATRERLWQVGGDRAGAWAHPALVGNRLYVRVKKHVLCYEIAGE